VRKAGTRVEGHAERHTKGTRKAHERHAVPPFLVKRLHQVCKRAGLQTPAEQKLVTLLRLIAADPEAPTSVTSPEEAVDAHVADSLSVLPLLVGRPPLETIVDIGSGAGFPGLPLAVAFDQAEVDLLEATARKCRFIERAIGALEQRNAHVVCERAEDWARSRGTGRYSLAVARAVAPLSTLVEYASPLLREGGLLVAWKGARDQVEEGQAAVAAGMLGMSPLGVEAVTPFAEARHRHLHVFEKTAPTPAGIPRRPGVAQKRPFGYERSASN
jgi:16S rRNA (guanine527-N7)-methyltransferase